MQKMAELAQFNTVTKTFGKHRAINELSFEVPQGQVIGLLGLNAAGKSTCLKLLAGLLLPSSGNVKVLGRAPRLQKTFIAYLSDKDALADWMTPQDSKSLMQGLFPDFRAKRFEELIGMLNVPDQRLKSMSKGQRTRLRLSLTLARKARLFLLDEPLSGIDLISREQILQALIHEWREDAAVIISTHELLEAEKLLDRVLLLKEGQLELDINPQVLYTQGKTLIDTFKEALA
jgi:ABC-2 type transport system ATP-binding protein